MTLPVLPGVIRFPATLRHPAHLCLCRGASGFVQLAQNQETRERVAIKYVCMRQCLTCATEECPPHCHAAHAASPSLAGLSLTRSSPAAAQVHPPGRAQQGGAVPRAAAPQRVRAAPQHRAAEGAASVSCPIAWFSLCAWAQPAPQHLVSAPKIHQCLPTLAYMPVLPYLQEVFLTPHHLGIAMEYVDGGDLAQWVQMHRIPDVSVWNMWMLNAHAHACQHWTYTIQHADVHNPTA